jgi:hypothetical protein
MKALPLRLADSNAAPLVLNNMIHTMKREHK